MDSENKDVEKYSKKGRFFGAAKVATIYDLCNRANINVVNVFEISSAVIKGKVQYVKERNMAIIMQIYAFAHIVQANRIRKTDWRDLLA